MSPLRVLERGYALVYGPDGKLLRSAAAVSAGAEISARLARGSLRATVTAKE
jgi:exodeoxyribonuclease VII large subunit